METTRVEVVSAHYYDRDRQPGERYDCANQYLPVVLGRGLVRIVDQQNLSPSVELDIIEASGFAVQPLSPNGELVIKRKRGRPFGSHGPYKKRSVVSETGVDR